MKTAPTRQGDLPRKADTSEVPGAVRQHAATGEAACRPPGHRHVPRATGQESGRVCACVPAPAGGRAGPLTVYRSWMRVLSPSWISRRSSAVLGYG